MRDTFSACRGKQKRSKPPSPPRGSFFIVFIFILILMRRPNTAVVAVITAKFGRKFNLFFLLIPGTFVNYGKGISKNLRGHPYG